MITKTNGVTEEHPTLYALEKSGIDLCQESGFIKEKALIDFLKQSGFENIKIKQGNKGIGKNFILINDRGCGGLYDFHNKFFMDKFLSVIVKIIELKKQNHPNLTFAFS